MTSRFSTCVSEQPSICTHKNGWLQCSCPYCHIKLTARPKSGIRNIPDLPIRHRVWYRNHDVFGVRCVEHCKKGLVNLMYILNAILRLEYWPKSLKTAPIIMIHKPGKNPMDVSSYRPISLLRTIWQVPEKLILKNINKDLNPQDWIPNHQFGFRQAHSTAQQCHLKQTSSIKVWKTSSIVQPHLQE